MPLPDDFSSARYRNAYEAPIIPQEPPLHVATRADVLAMQKYRGWLVVLLGQLRDNPWDYDSTEIPVHADVVREFESWLKQTDAAIEQARISAEAW